jgi:hypothetical protein
VPSRPASTVTWRRAAFVPSGIRAIERHAVIGERIATQAQIRDRLATALRQATWQENAGLAAPACPKIPP